MDKLILTFRLSGFKNAIRINFDPYSTDRQRIEGVPGIEGYVQKGVSSGEWFVDFSSSSAPILQPEFTISLTYSYLVNATSSSNLTPNLITDFAGENFSPVIEYELYDELFYYETVSLRAGSSSYLLPLYLSIDESLIGPDYSDYSEYEIGENESFNTTYHIPTNFRQPLNGDVYFVEQHSYIGGNILSAPWIGGVREVSFEFKQAIESQSGYRAIHVNGLDDAGQPNLIKNIIVLTHGWQRGGDPESSSSRLPALRDAVEDRLLREGIRDETIVFEFKWSEANTPDRLEDVLSLRAPELFTNLFAAGILTYDDYSYARQETQNAGGTLASFVNKVLDYLKGSGNPDVKIHLIGHSLGTMVNAFASQKINDEIDRFTILESPLDPSGILYPDSFKYKGVSYNTQHEPFFHGVLGENVKYVDNYYGGSKISPAPAFGQRIEGSENNKGGTFFPDSNHLEVVDDYAKIVRSGEWATPLLNNNGTSNRWNPQPELFDRFAETILGGEQDEFFFSRKGNDHISAGGGDDSVRSGSGDDTVYGERGQDVLEGQGDADLVFGGLGRDTLGGNRGDDDLRGGGQSDYIFGGRGNDVNRGGPGDDSVLGYFGNDTLLGQRGSDVLLGGPGDDSLLGGTGRDTIRASNGDDFLKGGAGRDTFVFDARDGSDVLADFGQGQDRLRFIGSDGINELDIRQSGNNTIIGYKKTTVRLIGEDADDFSASDFIF